MWLDMTNCSTVLEYSRLLWFKTLWGVLVTPLTPHKSKLRKLRKASDKVFLDHIDPTMPIPVAMVQFQSQMKSLMSSPLTKWMSQPNLL